jgi:hypothetical protein
MTYLRGVRILALGGLLAAVSACGILGGGRSPGTGPAVDTTGQTRQTREEAGQRQNNIWQFFVNRPEPGRTIEVNKYLWNASLDTLSFLPVQTVDPFTGVIVFGYGTPPGGGRPYRATVHIKDPALDARSLNVAVRQLRIADGTL